MDCAYHDDARGWLEEPAHGAPVTIPVKAAGKDPYPLPRQAAGRGSGPEQERPRFGGDPDTWPADLAAFRQWWLEEASLGESGAFPRILPRGDKGAAIMVIVPEPEEEDRDHLLSGPHGAMAQLVLRAMRIEQGSAYFASTLPRHTPLADWRGLAEHGLAGILRHHITLVEPRCVLVFGRPIAGLFGPDDAVFCAPGLDELRRSAQRRQRFWQRWLQWTEGQG